MTRSALAAVGVVAAALTLAACGGDDTARSANDDKPVVLTSFTVIADMAAQVAGDRVHVVSITKPGAEVHGYEPTPSDLKAAADADMVLENGLGLERWFKQFTDRAGAPTATLTDGIETIPIGKGTEYAGQPNPHAWLAPSNAEIYVENIRAALTRVDPAGEQEFRANAERYIDEIRAVGKQTKKMFAEVGPDQRALVTCEGAFSYLARDFDLTEQYLWPINAEQEGTPRQIADTIAFVRERKVPAVFCETTVSNKAQRQVADEAGAVYAGELYADSISAPGGAVPSYIEMLRHNGRTIAGALSGNGGGPGSGSRSSATGEPGGR